MRNWIVILLMMLLAIPVGVANTARDDDDKDPSIQGGIRRLHPERERAKAMKKLQEQMSRHAEEKSDPWDTSDEVWGTVDVPRSVLRDSAAVEGYRLTDMVAPDSDGRRLKWRDEPVTVSVDQLMPYFAVTNDGECRSKYVSSDSTSNEVYLAFAVDDSVPGPLRMCVRYCADAPIEFDQLTFTIDGFDYIFYPTDPQCKPIGNRQYLSFCDEELHEGYKDLVYALAHGKWVMLKLQGMGGLSRVKVLTDGQRDDFANTLALFLLLGGDFLPWKSNQID